MKYFFSIKREYIQYQNIKMIINVMIIVTIDEVLLPNIYDQIAIINIIDDVIILILFS